MSLDADKVWDAWNQARKEHPLLEIREFAQCFGEQAGEALKSLEIGAELERLRPTPLPIELQGTLSAELVFGPYRILEEIGRGGFGIVFDAVRIEDDGAGDEETATHVALKLVNPLVAVGDHSQAALLEEARILQSLVHPGIVSILACGRERGFVWIAMQRVHGVHLDQLPALEAEQRHARALRIGLQLADAVGAAHAQGVIHRDLKPSNVLVSDEQQVHILDFGLALENEVTVSLSRRGRGAGTPVFMAPEQLDPEGRVGRRTDIHALGYLLLLLAAPDARRALLASRRATRRMLGELRPLPRAVFRGLPRSLRVIVKRCLAPYAEDRYRSTSELTDDLEAAAAGQPLPHGLPSRARQTWRNIKRHKLAATAALAFLTGTGLTAWWFVWNAPVTTHIDCFLTGKRLTLNGELLGLTPVTTQLRPGVYDWQLQYGNGDAPTYRGQFEVERGGPNAFLFPLNPLPLKHWLDEAPYKTVPAEAGAWVRVGTRSAGVVLSGLPGHAPVTIDDYICFRLPRGTHELTLSAPGLRPLSRSFTIDKDRMHYWAAELDPKDSAWHTVTVYGPLDEHLRGTIIERENIRVYVESMIQVESDRHVYISYFGPIRSGVRSVIGFWVELPVEASALEITRIGATTNDTQAWVLVEMGPSPDSAVPLAFSGASDAAPAGSADLPSISVDPFEPSDTRTSERLSTLMQGHRRLFVRFTLGPTAAGNDYAYGCALRGEGGPEGPTWAPGLSLRVR